jgi:hypothetical protein
VGIVSTHSNEAAEARTIAAERDVVAMLPDIPVAEGGEGRRCLPRNHAQDGMEVLDVDIRGEVRTDRGPELPSKQAVEDDMRGVLEGAGQIAQPALAAVRTFFLCKAALD